MRTNYLFTSESVSEGHPDKVSDQISDAIVDLFLSKDPEARIACEALTTTQLVVLAGVVDEGPVDSEHLFIDGEEGFAGGFEFEGFLRIGADGGGHGGSWGVFYGGR